MAHHYGLSVERSSLLWRVPTRMAGRVGGLRTEVHFQPSEGSPPVSIWVFAVGRFPEQLRVDHRRGSGPVRGTGKVAIPADHGGQVVARSRHHSELLDWLTPRRRARLASLPRHVTVTRLRDQSYGLVSRGSMALEDRLRDVVEIAWDLR